MTASRTTDGTGRWTNWAGNQTSTPAEVAAPPTAEAVAEVVLVAARR